MIPIIYEHTEKQVITDIHMIGMMDIKYSYF